MNGIARRLLLFAFGVVAVASCSRTDGTPVDPAALGIKTCAADLDCGPGRFCSGDATCTVECSASADCVTKLADPSAPNTFDCSPCGRCVAKGVRDTRCLSATDQPCKSTDECHVVLGASYSCGADGRCARNCTDDSACKDVGRGWACGNAGVCVRACFRDADCWYHGWAYACALPAGVDPKANEDSPMPVYGECKKGGSPYKPTTPNDPPSAKYQGTWGWLATSAVRVDNVPIVTRLNSVNVQQMLTRVTWDGADLALSLKWCGNQVQNFREDDGPPFNLFNVVVPDRNVDSILVPTIKVFGVPALAPGAMFATSQLLDLRGARGLAHPLTDPLPSYHDLTGQWDQDRDGFPGMTANVTGALTGDLYQAQRWAAVFNAIVVDADHLHGLIASESAATVLGATKPDLINDSVTSTHPDATRTYFRAARLDDDASCDDVLRISTTMGSWLEFAPHFDAARRP